MSFTSSLILKLKRQETPLFKWLRSLVNLVFRPTAPRVPALLKPAFAFLYDFHYMLINLGRAAITIFYRHPLFQARCAQVGKNLGIANMPFVSGHVEIYIGDNVTIGGNANILSGRFFDHPRLEIRDRAQIGWNVSIAVNKEVIIEEDTIVANDCRISDSDGHHKDAELRAQNAPMPLREIRPVRICRHAWIGGGTYIMKGVTIGEGSIVGGNSVVISDVPPNCIAIGNPAEVIVRNINKKKAPSPPPSPDPE
jgi:acetyltransferase-like isoleucine patch superfamily enzyme